MSKRFSSIDAREMPSSSERARVDRRLAAESEPALVYVSYVLRTARQAAASLQCCLPQLPFPQGDNGTNGRMAAESWMEDERNPHNASMSSVCNLRFVNAAGRRTMR